VPAIKDKPKTVKNTASEPGPENATQVKAAQAQPSQAPVRQRLLEAAMTLFHEHGMVATTIATIAEAANVPLGNVYYHFRSKDDLIAAVVQARREEVKAELALAACEANPLERLRSLIRDSERNRELLTAHGCPYASLAQGLRDVQNQQANDAGELLRLHIDFAEVQFKALHLPKPRALGAEFISRLYGAFTLANAMGDATFLDSQLIGIERWLRQVASNAKTPTART
jgi:TetR/AcrR family transcriptional regulator, transcriptional repressor for nem operon